MQKIILKSGVSLAVASMLATGCIGNYLNINTNPFEVNKDQMGTDGYNVGAAISALCGTVISTDVNTAQFTDCLLGGPMGGYYSTTGAFDRTIDNFNPKDDWTRVFMASDRIIPTLYSNLAELEKITDDEVILTMAKVIKVAAMHRVTDTYGPIPYSKIVVGEKLAVEYDSQKDVYGRMFEELDEAVKVLKEHRGESVSANADPVFGGNVDKWCKFANSLKLRLAMRVCYTPEYKDKMRELLAPIMTNEIGLMTSNADNALLNAIAFGDKGNPIYTAVKYNQPKGCVTGGDTHAAAEIVSYMNAYNDPRREKYFIPSEFAGEEHRYVGVLISEVKPALTTMGRKYSGVNLTADAPLIWMNAAEVAFLKAEAAVLGFIDGSAEDYYNEGIRLSFEQYGVADRYNDYISNDSKASVTYLTPPGGTGASGVLTNLSVKWDDAATADQKQERVIIQKWIANYHLGNEAWADHRRTGYPKFFPASEAGNKSLGVNRVDDKMGARRMPYPETEKTANAENYSLALNLLGGNDNMNTRLWWDCKEFK